MHCTTIKLSGHDPHSVNGRCQRPFNPEAKGLKRSPIAQAGPQSRDTNRTNHQSTEKPEIRKSLWLKVYVFSVLTSLSLCFFFFFFFFCLCLIGFNARSSMEPKLWNSCCRCGNVSSRGWSCGDLDGCRQAPVSAEEVSVTRWCTEDVLCTEAHGSSIVSRD